MGRVNVEVGGRTYALSCGDGEEAHLAALGRHLAAKADELTGMVGAMSEPRLLLMAGLQVADELFAAKAGQERAASPAQLVTDAPSGDDPRLAALLARIEALAAAVEA